VVASLTTLKMTIPFNRLSDLFRNISIPDLHHFCNRGAKDVIPLWRDLAATQPNITRGLLELLSERYAPSPQPSPTRGEGGIDAEDVFAYAYALLATPEYVKTFWNELALPGPRLPLTKDVALFAQGVALGRRLIWLHTYGERCSTRRKTGSGAAGRRSLSGRHALGPGQLS
jgi:predicted helicase